VITLKRAYRDTDRSLLAAAAATDGTIAHAGADSLNVAQPTSTTAATTAPTIRPGVSDDDAFDPSAYEEDDPMDDDNAFSAPAYEGAHHLLPYGPQLYAGMNVLPSQQGQVRHQYQNFNGANLVLSTPQQSLVNAKRHRRGTSVIEFDGYDMPQFGHDELPTTPVKQSTLASSLAAARTPTKQAYNIGYYEPLSPISPTPRRGFTTNILGDFQDIDFPSPMDTIAEEPDSYEN
jgi:hypothetical protein